MPLPRADAPLADHLPFAPDDFDAVNALYARWCAGRSPADRRLLDIWTYGFVTRYFRSYGRRTCRHGRADVDLLVARVLAKVMGQADALRRTDRYAAWVSIVCRNTYLHYLEARRPMWVVAEPDRFAAAFATPGRALDRRLARRAVVRAIDRLPGFLREVARMRLLEERSYGEISARTGKPVPTLRAYTNRALRRLRADPAVSALWP